VHAGVDEHVGAELRVGPDHRACADVHLPPHPSAWPDSRPRLDLDGRMDEGSRIDPCHSPSLVSMERPWYSSVLQEQLPHRTVCESTESWVASIDVVFDLHSVCVAS
jgi:hypothetical protein